MSIPPGRLSAQGDAVPPPLINRLASTLAPWLSMEGYGAVQRLWESEVLALNFSYKTVVVDDVPLIILTAS